MQSTDLPSLPFLPPSLECFLLNSVLLLGSHFLYSRFLAPFLLLLGRCIYTHLLPLLLTKMEEEREGGREGGWEDPPARIEALVSVGCYVVYQVRRKGREGGREGRIERKEHLQMYF